MWADAGATGAIGFSTRRENWIEIEIVCGENHHLHVTRYRGNSDYLYLISPIDRVTP